MPVNDSNAVALPAIVEAPRSASEVKIRVATLEDYAQIAAVQERNNLGAKPEDQWRHLWVDNPVYKKVPDFPMGWVAVTPDSTIVGYMGCIPLLQWLQGSPIIACCTYAMSMDMAYRGNAGFLGRRFLTNRAVQMHLVTSANPNSSRLVGPLHGARVPSGDWNHSIYWITNYQGFAESALAMKKLPRFLAYPVATAMSARDTLTRRFSGSSSSGLSVSDSFDERFDSFWEELKRSYPNRLLADRSREVLNWHFKYARQQNRIWILTSGDKSRISSYAIFYGMDNRRVGLRRVRLIDFQTLDSDPKALAPMLAWAHERCRKEGIHMLEACGFRPDKEAVIMSLSPHRRELPSWFYYYYSRNKELAAILRNPDVWDPCHYDGDSSL